MMQKRNEKIYTGKWSRKRLLGFSLILIIIFIMILELVFRIIFFFKYRELNTTVSIQGSPLQQSDSLLVFKNTAFYVDYDRKFQNNEEGMKSRVGDEFIDNKQPGDFRILLTGGSAMEGMGSNRN